MTKNIKDYLHLYNGCTIRRFNKHIGTLDGKLCGFKDGFNESYILVNHGMNIVRVGWNEEFKPILRPLSSMTDDEAIEVCKFETPKGRWGDIEIEEIRDNKIWYLDGSMFHGDGISEYEDCFIYFNQLDSEQFRFLISKHFDLFGLIKEGLAIDATTLTNS